MRRVRATVTYANVVATLALFIALGGASYAAIKLPKNSVGTKQIKNGAVTGAKLKNGVTGDKIDLASLGTVPSATAAASANTANNAAHATSADTAASAADAQALQGLSPAQIVAASKLGCQADMVEVAGLCFEEGARPKANFETALTNCAEANSILPSLSEMHTFNLIMGNEASPEWTGLFYVNGASADGVLVVGSNFSAAANSSSFNYRCAVPASNR